MFTLCGKQASVYSFLSSSQSTLGNKKTTTFPRTVLTPTLTAKEATAAVGGSELNSSLRKSKRADRQEPVGIFFLLPNHLPSSWEQTYPVPGNSLLFRKLRTKQLHILTFRWIVWTQPQASKKKKKKILPHAGAKKSVFLVLNGYLTKFIILWYQFCIL